MTTDRTHYAGDGCRPRHASGLPRRPDPPLHSHEDSPPDPLDHECEECGTPIDGQGWCTVCARRVRREVESDD